MAETAQAAEAVVAPEADAMDAVLEAAQEAPPEADKPEVAAEGAEEGQSGSEGKGAEEVQPDAEPAEKVEPEAAAAPDDDEVDISDLMDESGKSVDAAKLRNLKKSYVHAQRMLGKTAKDREKLKGLPELEAASKDLQQFRTLAQRHPFLMEAANRAVAIENGQAPPAQAPAAAAAPKPTEADAKQQYEELMAEGRFWDAQQLAAKSAPVNSRIAALEKELQQERTAAERRRAEADAKAEMAAFKKNWTGVVFDKEGGVADQELYEETVKIFNANPRMKVEHALGAAALKLKRSLFVPKRRVSGSGQARLPKAGLPLVDAAADKNGEREIIPGFTEKDLLE